MNSSAHDGVPFSIENVCLIYQTIDFLSRTKRELVKTRTNDCKRLKLSHVDAESLAIPLEAEDCGNESPSVKKKAACRYDVGQRAKHSLQFQHSLEAILRNEIYLSFWSLVTEGNSVLLLYFSTISNT